VLSSAIAIALSQGVRAADDMEELRRSVETLQRQLEAVQAKLKVQEEKMKAQAAQTASKQEVRELQEEVADAASWKDPNTLFHMAGYGDVNFEKRQGDNSSFTVGSFSPIFHFQYRDIVMLESELEYTVDSDGGTEAELEYMTIDWFANDYMVVQGGKFLSPIGQFRQNLHPSWINKMTTAPPGFGHDGAAPVSDLGVQLRGGIPIGEMFANYAVYVGNGPELNSTTEDGTEFSLEGIRAEAFGKDADGEKVFGGRLGLLPIPSVEIGLSGAIGKAEVTKLENEATGTTAELSGQSKRDYSVFGSDFSWRWEKLGLRGEYVRSRVGSANGGGTPSPSAKWTAWYAQASYRLLPTKFELVARYADFDSPKKIDEQSQWGFGINYLFTGNFIAKLNYELNDGRVSGSQADDNLLKAQLAYGF